MDALELLKDDHRKVSKLFEKVMETTERAIKTREELYSQIYSQLSLHTKMEEKLFYPVLKEYETMRSLVLEANEEHNLVKLLLEELKGLAYDDEKWKPRCSVLRENVEHHVEEEENDLFPKVRKELTSSALKTMGEEMQEFKRKHTK